MIIEITTYNPAPGVTHHQLLQASKAFNQNYCARCKGLISRQFAKTASGYMDIFTWETRQDVEHVQATFMEDADALAYADHLDPETLAMYNYELLGSYEAGKI